MSETPVTSRVRPGPPALTRAVQYAQILRRHIRPENRSLITLVTATVLTGVAVGFLDSVPVSVMVLPLVLASVLLGPNTLPWFTIFLLAVVTFTVPFQTMTSRLVTQIVLIFVIALIVLFGSFRRSRLGVAGARGEQMFVDLRDRILARTGLPELPDRWYAQSALRSAGGTPFSGDFVVSGRRGSWLSVAVIDVSGKGEDAATRALLLAGAFDGLLGVVGTDEFLPAANDYLLRQAWEEGFATAVHLAIDLDSGEFHVRTAGHPPAAHFAAGNGRWGLVETQGPILGLVEGAVYEPAIGRLSKGDAMLLYTDGLVETKDRDIMLGIDKMVGQAERLLSGGFTDGANTLVNALGSASDDKAIIVIHRR
ncbi:MAG: PP2C family protein-serine/threonine phosphatase [Nocardioides sp.]